MSIESASSLEELSIMLVVPSMVQGAVLKRELDFHGVIDIASCQNVAQALDKMKSHKAHQPDLVISSMYFEDGDGIDLISAMRADESLANILFMLVSSEERFEMLDPIRQAGVVAVLPKPFNRDTLSQALNTSLGFLGSTAFVANNTNIQKIKVLLVDDSRLARRHMNKVLSKVGITDEQITQAIDGANAVECLKEHTFDLVITDYNMPKMDGEELLKYIRQHDDLSNMPVIMVTSEQNETKLGSIKSNGVTAMMDKPFDPPHLKSLLEAHI